MTTEVRRVKISTGGTLVMSLEDANPLRWSKTDRTWFFAIVDALFAYEEAVRLESNAEAKKIFDEIRRKLEALPDGQALSPNGTQTLGVVHE